MSAHVDDRAALYALGLLDDDERAALQAHLRECPGCALSIGAAEDDVASLVAAQSLREPPRELASRIERSLSAARSTASHRTWAAPVWLAAAAAIVIAVMPAAWFWNQNRAMQEAMSNQSAAMTRVASAPHRNAEFAAMPANMTATVAYAPNGEWYVIVVKNASKALDVAWMHDGTQTMLGRAVPHGDTAMLYLPKSHRMNSLALMDGERVVAEANLSYE